MKAQHLMMVQYVSEMIETYLPSVEEWNKTDDNSNKAFNQWLETVERNDANSFGIDIETFIRSDANVNDLATLHDWAKSIVKLTQDLLTTQMFVANHTATESNDSGNTEQNLMEQFTEIQTLFKTLRDLKIPDNELSDFLPTRMGKAPKSGKEIIKLNIPRPRSETKQIRSNSTHIKLIVDGVQSAKNFGEALTEMLNISLPEFIAELEKTHNFTVYDLADGEEVEMFGHKISVTQS